MKINGEEKELRFTYSAWKQLKEKKITPETLDASLMDDKKLITIVQILTGSTPAEIKNSFDDLTQAEIVDGITDAYVASLPVKMQIQYNASIEMLKKKMPEMLDKMDLDKVIQPT